MKFARVPAYLLVTVAWHAAVMFVVHVYAKAMLAIELNRSRQFDWRHKAYERYRSDFAIKKPEVCHSSCTAAGPGGGRVSECDAMPCGNDPGWETALVSTLSSCRSTSVNTLRKYRSSARRLSTA